MKEALFFNECFVKSIVKCETASLSTQPEQFDHPTKYETTCHEHHIASQFAEVATFRTPMIE